MLKKSKRILCALFALVFVLTGTLSVCYENLTDKLVTAQAAVTMNKVTNNKDHVSGDISNSNRGWFDWKSSTATATYAIISKKVKWGNATVKLNTTAEKYFKYKKNDSNRVVLLNDETGLTKTGRGSLGTITVTFPDAAIRHSDGTLHDVILKITDIYIASGTATVKKGTEFIKGIRGGFHVSAGSSENPSLPDLGWRFKTIVDIEDATNSDKIYMKFEDLDVSNFDNEYSTNITKFPEAVSIRNSKIAKNASGDTIAFNTWKDSTLLQGSYSNDGTNYTVMAAGAATNDGNEKKSTFSCVGIANEFEFLWSGRGCGSTISLSGEAFDPVSVSTAVVWQNVDGSYPPLTEDYATDIDSKIYSNLDSHPVYQFTARTIQQTATHQSLTIPAFSWTVTGDKTFYYQIPRRIFTYRFNANMSVAGKTVANMPSDFQRLAEQLSDAAIATPQCDGFKFIGWSNSPAYNPATTQGYAPSGVTTQPAGTIGYPGAESMLSDKTFYAHWQRTTYQVIFNANGDSNPDYEEGESTQNKTNGTMANQVIDYDTDATLNANQFTRDGYEFIGWSKSKTPTNSPEFANGATVNNTNLGVAYGLGEQTVTLYAQWRKKLGTETIKVISEETGKPVPGVTMQLKKDVNGIPTNVGSAKTTNANGEITVKDLHWFNYTWEMTGQPNGYKKSGNTNFRITFDHLSETNEVILYMKHVSVTLDSQIDCIIKGENPPAFAYHVSGTDVAGVKHEYNVLVQTNSTKTGTNSIKDMFAGTYTVTQIPVSRYKAGNAEPISGATANGINATLNLVQNDKAEVLFPYTLTNHGWYSGTDSAINRLSK